MLNTRFSGKKTALFIVYLSATFLGTLLGDFLVFPSQIGPRLELLLMIPLLQLFVGVFGITLPNGWLFTLSGIAAVLFGFLFFKNKKKIFLVLFGVMISFLSFGGVCLIGLT
ncbi:hypothetical protein IPG41_05625 [Candidatus Peregrinibacteria bacterium]|nr:MAG: hypothetical protein IPG41_05625 [Candidatus Peregrinibacteria bacterium]